MSTNSRIKTLTECIIESLRQGEMVRELEQALIMPNRTQVYQRDETEYWDFKEDIDLDHPQKIALLAKWLLGFHNAKGGVIIFGVSNDFRIPGFYESKLIDSVRLRNKVAKYAGPDLPIFQGTIPSNHNGKVVWLLFVHKRVGLPVAAAGTSTNDASGKPIVSKGQYFIRIGDEVRLCVSPSDHERLFTGVSFKHISSYAYEVDEPYFRLLEPHHSKFVGRTQLIEVLQEALSSRSYIISLDGVGGVGKSAIAIEMVRRLYNTKVYQFIVSLSAKNRVWHHHTETRQAGFSGFTEFLMEIAKVLQIPTVGTTAELLRHQIVDLMKDTDGLLLIDNIEEVQDPAIFNFLKDEVPAPVKVLVTSRISRNLGARTITIPEMTADEAHTLLTDELENVGYTKYVFETEDVKEIINATGCLPLALKWAAALARNATSLKQVSTHLRQHDSTRREFLDFCFATMFDELSDLAQEVAMLYPYLEDEWNTVSLAVALDQPLARIERAINELEDRGILDASTSSREGSILILPLTSDFLKAKWLENKNLRDAVMKRISEAGASTNYEGTLFSWPLEERVAVLSAKAPQLLMAGDPEQALKILRLALRWACDPQDVNQLQFLEGRAVYETGEKREGIARMATVIESLSGETWAEDTLYWASVTIIHGRNEEEQLALRKFLDHFADSTNLDRRTFEEFCMRAIRQSSYAMLATLIERVKLPLHAYWIADSLLPYLQDTQLTYTLGEPLIDLLVKANMATEASEEDRKKLNVARIRLTERFHSKGHRAQT